MNKFKVNDRVKYTNCHGFTGEYLVKRIVNVPALDSLCYDIVKPNKDGSMPKVRLADYPCRRENELYEI